MSIRMNAHRFYCLAVALLLPASVAALPPDPGVDERFAFRLLLGRFDGAENAAVLHDDGHRYTVGVSASSPVAWEGRVDANMEIWVTERGYEAATTPAGEPTDSMTLKAEALSYGVRVHTGRALRPYGLLALGFQATHLRTAARSDPSILIEEDSLEPTLNVGFGMEWEVGRDLFAIDWRRAYTEGNFTDFGVRNAQLGGEFFGIGLGHRW